MKLRPATFSDLFNPRTLDFFYITIPEIGLIDTPAADAGSFDENGCRFYLMRLASWDQIVKPAAFDFVFSVQIKCTLDQIKVEDKRIPK